MSARHCRRKHYKLWQRKTLTDINGKVTGHAVVCPYCGVIENTEPRLH